MSPFGVLGLGFWWDLSYHSDWPSITPACELATDPENSSPTPHITHTCRAMGKQSEVRPMWSRSNVDNAVQLLFRRWVKKGICVSSVAAWVFSFPNLQNLQNSQIITSRKKKKSSLIERVSLKVHLLPNAECLPPAWTGSRLCALWTCAHSLRPTEAIYIQQQSAEKKREGFFHSDRATLQAFFRSHPLLRVAFPPPLLFIYSSIRLQRHRHSFP